MARRKLMNCLLQLPGMTLILIVLSWTVSTWLQNLVRLIGANMLRFLIRILIIGIHHNKVSTLAKQTGKKIPNFQAQSENYPSFVSLKTEAFTKLTATVSRDASNTLSGFCTSIMISKEEDPGTVRD